MTLELVKIEAPEEDKYPGVKVMHSKYEEGVIHVSATDASVAMFLVKELRKHAPYKLTDLVRVYGKVRAKVDEGYDSFEGLALFLDDNTATFRAEAAMRREQGLIAYSDIILLFNVGDEVVAQFENDLLGGTVTSVEEQNSFFGSSTVVKIKTVSATGGLIKQRVVSFSIREFEDLRPIKDLHIRPVSPAEKAELTERGRKFRSYTSKPSYVRYTGNLIRRYWYGDQAFRADGRVMIDALTASRMDNELFNSYREWGQEDSEGKKANFEIPDSLLWTCEPFVFGFSFRNKQWGELRVEALRDIEFRENAIEQLVLPEDRKKLILALVTHAGSSFSDVIEEKGGGNIFLLHGEPGLGKTLTAEAVAEHLKRPLYSVSIGELGTDPAALEEALREILDVASAWNAVILLDEADIFLEKRDERDIVRNAMVGVFLRLLEYHQGVLFLTTNRVRNFDKAFHSRISVALKYPDADDQFRQKVWCNLFEAAGIRHLDPVRFAHFKINGRQIKNTIRLAQTLAKSENREVSQEDIERTVAITNQFQADLKVE